MRFRRAAYAVATPLPLAAAIITWLPIAVGIVLGTLARAAVFVFGGQEHGAAAASILCAGAGATLSALWFGDSARTGDWRGTLKLSAFWVLLSIAFRALWLGAVVGGGWPGVALDYRVWEGQPGGIVVALVAVAPFILEARRPEARAD